MNTIFYQIFEENIKLHNIHVTLMQHNSSLRKTNETVIFDQQLWLSRGLDLRKEREAKVTC